LVLPFSCSPTAPEKKKKTHKKQRSGAYFIFDTLSITLVVSGPPIGDVICLSKCRDDVVDWSCESRCMGLGSNSWDILITDGVRLLVVLLVVVWPVVSDMPIYDGFLDMYVGPAMIGR
jgi:hypothetical protein